VPLHTLLKIRKKRERETSFCRGLGETLPARRRRGHRRAIHPKTAKASMERKATQAPDLKGEKACFNGRLVEKRNSKNGAPVTSYGKVRCGSKKVPLSDYASRREGDGFHPIATNGEAQRKESGPWRARDGKEKNSEKKKNRTRSISLLMEKKD